MMEIITSELFKIGIVGADPEVMDLLLAISKEEFGNFGIKVSGVLIPSFEEAKVQKAREAALTHDTSIYWDCNAQKRDAFYQGCDAVIVCLSPERTISAVRSALEREKAVLSRSKQKVRKRFDQLKVASGQPLVLFHALSEFNFRQRREFFLWDVVAFVYYLQAPIAAEEQEAS